MLCSLFAQDPQPVMDMFHPGEC